MQPIFLPDARKTTLLDHVGSHLQNYFFDVFWGDLP
jgi:hypothetical protein